MTAFAILQIAVFFGILLLITKPLGSYMARVFAGEKTFLHGALGWLERGTYRVLGVDPEEDMKWTTYSVAMLVFSLATMAFTYAALRLQGVLPLNPQGFGVKQMTPDLAFNTAASFTTNTNWQSYSPEVTLSYFSNMVALAIHNWASAAVGMAIAIALIRGFARKNADGVGNFWADVVRCTLYILLPLAFVGALVFLAMGVPQNFDPYTTITTLEGGKQTIASARSRRRRSSSSSARTAAASSTRTPRTRSRTPRRSPTSSPWYSSGASRRRSRTRSARWSVTRSKAGPSSAPWPRSPSPG